MNKPIIGIVSKPNILCDTDLFTQQIIYDGVRCAILKNNGLCLGILPTQRTNKFFEKDDETDETKLSNQEKKDLYSLINRCDGVILEGGLSSASYELEIAKYAIKKDIPLLGICAGFNNIIRAFGGTVVTLKQDTIHNQEDGKLVHKNRIKKDSLLYSILDKKEIKVNSIHTMFALDKNIKNLEISAISDDGYVEAVELKRNKFVLGLLWHPELMLEQESMNKIFEVFINACKK